MNRLFALLIVALVIPCSLAAEDLPPDLGMRTFGNDWPAFLGPERNGHSPEAGLNTDWNAHPPRVVWQCQLGASYSAPSVSRGRLFHFDRHGDKHRLTCRNSETGAELWRYELPADFEDMLGYNNGPRATPVVDGAHVYVMSPEGRLHCVRTVDGKKMWAIDTSKEFGVVKNFFGVGSTPVVWQDLVIANIGGSPPGSPPDVYAAGNGLKGNGSGVVAFDKLTGKVRWQSTDELASYASPVISVVGGQPRCFVFARGGLVMLDPQNGKVGFHFPWRAVKLESVNASSPVVVGDEVFISESYSRGSALLRIKRVDEPLRGSNPGAESRGHMKDPVYKVVWQDVPRSREKAMELHWNTAVFHDGHLYGSSGQHGGSAELRCIEWRSGKVKWSEPRLTRSSLLYADGRFICLSEDGALRLLKATPERYEEVAQFTPRDEGGEPLLTYPAWAAPVLAHGLLYVRGNDRLVCLDLTPPAADQ